MPETKEKDKEIKDVKLALPARSRAPGERPRTSPTRPIKAEKAADVLPEDPEELAKYKAEKLNALIEKGKKAGKLTSKS